MTTAKVEKVDLALKTRDEQEAVLDALLGSAADSVAQERQDKAVSLATMLGDYEPIPGHPGFCARAPKLRQQIEIARLADEASNADPTVVNNIEGAAQMARMALFVSKNGADGDTSTMRQATIDEVLDEFTMAEVADVLTRYLGMVPAKDGGADPNAESLPIGTE